MNLQYVRDDFITANVTIFNRCKILFVPIFDQSRIHFTQCAINFGMYYYDSPFMNISNYVYDACRKIYEIVTDVRSMLITKGDQKLPDKMTALVVEHLYAITLRKF